MGCSASNSDVIHFDRPDRYDGISMEFPKQRPAARKPSRIASLKRISPHTHAQMVVAPIGICKDKGDKEYRSYIDTPVNAPDGMATMPDRDLHEAHLERLSEFISIVEMEPRRFQEAIARARWESFPDTTPRSARKSTHHGSNKLQVDVETISRKPASTTPTKDGLSIRGSFSPGSLASKKQPQAPSEIVTTEVDAPAPRMQVHSRN
eukprot:CAMPEP_0169195120 /NCGR_PEP_ID=MMETSP1016-20121227/7047_1 /TAXON_ID=342587 /ORGANISM="Karlodinium micrum, Strain CCMP2283" /LENGTH=206 /DNA_ID=CAMNT_0009271643 /DNA_START=36 /DNA_END=657 /DNA_ORIENTATION=+